MVLVDTSLLSASAPRQESNFSELLNWMDSNSQLLYLSAITLAEVEDGIAKAQRQGATRKAGRLSAWLETVLHL
jgi:predicted nucleic acid-binding protein